MKKLKTLEEYNNEKQAEYATMMKSSPTGIACPECGGELLANYNFTLTSYPPQVYANCPKCKWHGTIIQ